MNNAGGKDIISYSIMVGNRMLAEKVDKDSMAGFLSTPTTRMQITVSSALYFILSLAVMWGVVSLAGIPLYFFVVSMFIKLSDDLDFLKNFTLNTLFDTQKILEGSGYIQDFVIMGAMALVLYAVGIIWFEKKDLPL